MHSQGSVIELMLVDGLRSARLGCARDLVPAAGQYVLSHEVAAMAPLADSLFASRRLSDGFMVAPPVPEAWRPGTLLHLRGPLGHGFELPGAARRVALVACDNEPRRLLALLEAALNQGAAVTLVCDQAPSDLPMQLEIQPWRAVADVCRWSDYAAFDMRRESMSRLVAVLARNGHLEGVAAGQALIRVPMPCGGVAECGVCAVKSRTGPQLACAAGPVFDLALLRWEG